MGMKQVWYLECDDYFRCRLNKTCIYLQNKRAAKDFAMKTGWLITGKKVLCPDCREIK